MGLKLQKFLVTFSLSMTVLLATVERERGPEDGNIREGYGLVKHPKTRIRVYSFEMYSISVGFELEDWK